MDQVACPEDWDYEEDTKKRESISRTVSEIVVELRTGRMDPAEGSADTRRVHWRMFADFAPPAFPYFAGSYRGEDHRCLRDYEVHIPSDPRVGSPAAQVPGEMRALAVRIRRGLGALDEIWRRTSHQGRADQLVRVARFSCEVFEAFLRVHPYANGNGHTGRFILWAMLARYGFYPNRWRIDPRPDVPEYSKLIERFRSGDRDGLVSSVLAAVIEAELP